MARQVKEQSLKEATRVAGAQTASRATVQLDPDLAAELDEQADREGTNRAALNRKAVRFYLDSVNGVERELHVVSINSARAGGGSRERKVVGH